jgi:hypothetical protein
MVTIKARLEGMRILFSKKDEEGDPKVPKGFEKF